MLFLITANTLGLNVGSGTAYADGRNYQNDPNNPSYITDLGTTVSKIFRYYQVSGNTFVQDTNNASGYTELDVSHYNLNGTITAVPGTGSNREWSLQRIFWYPNSATKGIVAYYGNKTYTSATEAAANLPYEPFFETENTKGEKILYIPYYHDKEIIRKIINLPKNRCNLRLFEIKLQTNFCQIGQ